MLEHRFFNKLLEGTPQVISVVSLSEGLKEWKIRIRDTRN